MAVIIGIDPGSRITGYGVIESNGNQHRYISCGCIKVKGTDVADRLLSIYNGVCEVIQQFQPEQAAIEQVFVHINPNSALKLGQARGVAIVASAKYAVNISEYAPKAIKKAVVGYGGADKQQVAVMVCRILGIATLKQYDTTDALAVALCHATIQKSRDDLNRALAKEKGA